MNLEDYMPAISDAARIVKASLPPGHGLELADLVNIGAERVLTYLAGSEGVTSTLAFVCAKHGMTYAVRLWAGHGHTRKVEMPKFSELDETRDTGGPWDIWRRSSALDIESIIDLKRALLSMQLREAVAWYSHHWLCEELDHLEGEFGVSEGRIRQYCAAAREKLAAAWRGDSFETEDEKRARRAAADRATAERRAVANVKMLAERRWRTAELKRLGATPKEARRAGAAQSRFVTLCRQLTVEAAE